MTRVVEAEADMHMKYYYREVVCCGKGEGERQPKCP